VCVACGLWGGLAIGLQTEYFTSNRYRPVQVRCCSQHLPWLTLALSCSLQGQQVCVGSPGDEPALGYTSVCLEYFPGSTATALDSYSLMGLHSCSSTDMFVTVLSLYPAGRG
jgi:hypothetical protein